MASVGSASLTIVPKIDNLGKTVTSALSSAASSNASSTAGAAVGTSFAGAFNKSGSGLIASGAVMGAVSALAVKATDMISSSISSAVSRVDTMANYPRVMQQLGFSAEEASKSIETMGARLRGLPTTLNGMAQIVQGIVAINGDLTESTALGLAFNDMMLAGGAGTAAATAATEQFRQVLAKGKPEMQDWKSIVQAAPGQMKQLAEAMLGAGASASDLYSYLGGGAADAFYPERMQEFTDAVIRLDTEGAEGITSFAEQAKSATGGISTSIDNMGTAVSRGVGKVLEAIGQDTIANALTGIGSAFESALGGAAQFVGSAKEEMTGFASGIQSTIPLLAGMAAGAVAVNGAISAWSFASKINPVSAGVTIAAAGIGLLASAALDAKRKSDLLQSATSGLADAARDAGKPISAASDAYSALGSSASESAKSLIDARAQVEKAVESQASIAESISSRNVELQGSIGLLEAHMETIGEYANKSGLAASEQAKLEFAVQQVNEMCGTQYGILDAENGVIADQNGVIQENTSQIKANVEARERQLKLEAVSEGYKELYKQQFDNQQALRDAQQTRDEIYAQYDDALEQVAKGVVGAQEVADGMKASLDAADKAVSDAEKSVRSCNDAMSDMMGYMAQISTGADVIAETMGAMGEEVASDVSEMFGGFGNLAQALTDAGVTAEEMSAISSDAFARMLADCGGDLDSLVSKIKAYNGVSIEDKTTNIVVNGEGALSNALSKLREMRDEQDVTRNVTVNYTQSGLPTGSITVPLYGNAAGGIRMHAAGAIATKAVPLDIVGEAGAEAIVPLTNKRYSEPFAKMIAQQVAEVPKASSARITNVYVNGVEVKGTKADDLGAMLLEIIRYQDA